MNLTGDLKKQVEKAGTKGEKKSLIENAGMLLTAYSGGQRPLLRSETAVQRSQRHTAFCKTLCRERLFT